MYYIYLFTRLWVLPEINIFVNVENITVIYILVG